MEAVLPLVGAILAGAVASLITALFLRRSSRETNETNAFDVVTKQLFKMNEAQGLDIKELKAEVKELRVSDKEKGIRIEKLEIELGSSKKAARNLAGYIRLLIQRWPGPEAPPTPDPPIDWEQHL